MIVKTIDGVKNLLIGLGVTFKNLFSTPVTISYPEVKRIMPERYRGRHYLNRDENGLERCIGCSLCSINCPVGCIHVVSAENNPDHPISQGERYAEIYEINPFLRVSAMQRFMKSTYSGVFIVGTVKRHAQWMLLCCVSITNWLITIEINTLLLRATY